jgi:hypothetical protein
MSPPGIDLRWPTEQELSQIQKFRPNLRMGDDPPIASQPQVRLIARREFESCTNPTGTCIQRPRSKAYEGCGGTRDQQFLAD